MEGRKTVALGSIDGESACNRRKGRIDMKNRTVWTMVLVSLLLVLAVAAQAQESEPEAVVMSFFEALNAGDVEGALAYFAEDTVLAIIPFGTHSGTEEIRAYLENGASLNATIEYEILQVEGDTVSLKSWYTDDDLRGIGVKLEGMEEITIQDGKITADSWTATEEAMAALQAAMAGLPQTGAGGVPLYAIATVLGGLVAGGGFVLKRYLTHRA
jgi:limonene-1,2-epoxide hydrolase